MADILSGKTPPKGGGTTKNDSPVIAMPKHQSGIYNPYNRASNNKGTMPKIK
jgi:hypothetical protein